jgi:hypothetical protein
MLLVADSSSILFCDARPLSRPVTLAHAAAADGRRASLKSGQLGPVFTQAVYALLFLH